MRTKLNSTHVIYWASRSAQITSSSLRYDLSRWNMHRRGHVIGDLGGATRATRATAIGSDSHFMPDFVPNVKAN